MCTLLCTSVGFIPIISVQVKIQGQNKEMLAAACQMFLGKTENEVAHIALETLEGHQRAIMAHMTVEVGDHVGQCNQCQGRQNTSLFKERSLL